MKPKCSVRVQVNKRWRNCPGEVAITIDLKGQPTPLCLRCAHNVRDGSYGYDMRLQILRQWPILDQPEAPRMIKLPRYGIEYPFQTGTL
jgi:hypothetical protein